MRSTYYQDPGNPVQVDRLPKTSPSIELLAPPMSSIECTGRTIATLSLMAGAATATMLICPYEGIDWLEPFDLVYSLVTLLIGLGIALKSGRVHACLHPAVLVAVGLLCLNHRIPWWAVAVLASASTTCIIFAFGWHAAVLSTATPMPRKESQRIRNQCEEQLAVIGLLVGVAIAWMLWANAMFPRMALLALPVAVGAILISEPLTSRRTAIVIHALTSWLTYDSRRLPGLLQSPIGPPDLRSLIFIFGSLVSGIVFVRWPESPLATILDSYHKHHDAIMTSVGPQSPSTLETLRYSAFSLGVGLIYVLAIPVLAIPILALSASLTVLFGAHRGSSVDGSTQELTDVDVTKLVLSQIQTSPDQTERQSLYLGRVVADGSPVLIPFSVFREHAHCLGDSGGGKTSLFLCPIIEQLIASRDCSVIVIDLKGDKLELLASLVAAAEAKRDGGLSEIPLKVFSNQSDRSTFAFNPLTQPFWHQLDAIVQTDILCAANGLHYGNDYGPGWYSHATAGVLHHTIKAFPGVTTFRELADCIGTVINTAKKKDLHPEVRRAGVHVHEVFKRLAACLPINVSSTSGHEEKVHQNAIDLTEYFKTPGLLYCHLPATLSPGSSPEIARLFTYILLAAATKTTRSLPVFLVIDEFQRMVASNLEYMLQLARSMGVGIILANQSMEDLKKSTTNLIPAVEANCRLRQWFSVSSSDDRARLIELSGQTVDTTTSWTESSSSSGTSNTSRTTTEQVVPRLTENDIALVNDHPFRSILRISRSAGYGQFGGLPVIVESQYHITEDEYHRRQDMAWPLAEGTFIPGCEANTQSATQNSPILATNDGPQWSEEILKESSSGLLSDEGRKAMEELFSELGGELKRSDRSRSRRPRR